MLLVFPTGSEAVRPSEEVCFVRDLQQERFQERVASKVSEGWVVHEMTSAYRKTLFGGVSSFRAEMRRGGRGKGR